MRSSSVEGTNYARKEHNDPKERHRFPRLWDQ